MRKLVDSDAGDASVRKLQENATMRTRPPLFQDRNEVMKPVGEYPQRNWDDLMMSAEENPESLTDNCRKALDYIDHDQPDMQLSREGKELDPKTDIAFAPESVGHIEDGGYIIPPEAEELIRRMTPHSEVPRGKTDAEWESGEVGVQKHYDIKNMRHVRQTVPDEPDWRKPPEVWIDEDILCKVQREAELHPCHDEIDGACGHITCKHCHPGNLANHLVISDLRGGTFYTLKDGGVEIDLTDCMLIVRDNGEIIPSRIVNAVAGIVTLTLGLGDHELEFEVIGGSKCLIIDPVRPHGR